MVQRLAQGILVKVSPCLPTSFRNADLSIPATPSGVFFSFRGLETPKAPVDAMEIDGPWQSQHILPYQITTPCAFRQTKTWGVAHLGRLR